MRKISFSHCIRFAKQPDVIYNGWAKKNYKLWYISDLCRIMLCVCAKTQHEIQIIYAYIDE
jgi:hypothetical protein